MELDCKFARVETLASPAPPHVFHSAVAKRVSARPVPANKKNPRHQPQSIIRFEAESFHTLPDSIPHNLNPSHHRLSSERIVGITVSSHGEPRSFYPNSRPLEVPKTFSAQLRQLAIGLNTPAPPE